MPIIKERGIIHLLPLLLIAALVGAAIFLISQGKIKLPGLPFLQKKATNVELKTEYKNPFKQETQYVNPFETYKNPFTVAK